MRGSAGCCPLHPESPGGGGEKTAPCVIGAIDLGRRRVRHRLTIQLRIERRSRPPIPAARPITRLLLLSIQDLTSLPNDEPSQTP